MSVLRERKYFAIARVSFCVNNLIWRWAEIGRSQESCRAGEEEAVGLVVPRYQEHVDTSGGDR